MLTSQIRKLNRGQLRREELLDIATVLSFVVESMEWRTRGDAASPGVEREALLTRSVLRTVRSCVLWLKVEGHRACVTEMSERLHTACRDALRAAGLLREIESRLGEAREAG